MMRGDSKPVDDFQLDRPRTKQHRAKLASKLSGRPSTERLAQSRQESLEFLADLGYESTASTRPNSIHHQDAGFLHRVSTWLHQERSRRAHAKAKRKTGKGIDQALNDKDGEVGISSRRKGSNASTDSEGSAALEKLQEILAAGLALSDRPGSRRGLPSSYRPSSFRKLRRASTAASSDTEYLEGDALVPTCEAILDNSKTLAYSGGGADEEDASEGVRPALSRATSSMNRDAWKNFKYEIVRLTHTLRLKGWRKVSMEMSSQIEVERLSGALTNAVYVVSPPKDIPAKETGKADQVPQPRRPPPYVFSLHVL
jgi:choline kinase